MIKVLSTCTLCTGQFPLSSGARTAELVSDDLHGDQQRPSLFVKQITSFNADDTLLHVANGGLSSCHILFPTFD